MTLVSPSNQPSSNSSGARIIGHATSTGGAGPNVMAATTLTGDKVLSSDGKEIGKVIDIMLDVCSGRIAYVVLSCGGFLGMGDKLFAVPWGAFTLDTDEKCFRLDATEERMKSASGFDKDHWPATADSQWGWALHSGNTPPM
ncbi:PRC-barrel domain-containing protein [Burkholderia ambifaria]|jgi:sporulation protein YlmC with PRC-barrel domain|uniref:PRC-barrel domain protein n=1 Tax=Burkholderia ambifaria IOP40-10 TaxID=396596 RepID=B1F7K8_9BURK|nr:PRC-barrel domain-containing protein [Burkholderia ambifaria]EDT06265.1 PRC-barrel domain protein [Burkholderia ambifaria IOP40-10]UEP51431.1 PRC-barrel domain-containing protein [Burkholderia ambifaria]